MRISQQSEQALINWGAIHKAVQLKASDLHISAGSPPVARVNGELHVMDFPELTAAHVDSLIGALASERQQQYFRDHPELPDLDYTVEFPKLGRRFRVNIFRQFHGPSIAMRILADEILSLSELGVPEKLEELALSPSGLILVTGGTGSGKSTTLAGMIEFINRRRAKHIITIEDPIEFVFQNRRSLIEQREVGVHTKDFDKALKSALREAPDVILVGEIRDEETAQMALRSSLVGSLVMATLHTRSAQETVGRYISMFRDTWRASVRSQLCDCLLAVCSQKLLPRLDRPGRVAACELLLGTTGVRNIIREDRPHLLHSLMEISSKQGMISMEQSLYDLIVAGKVDLQVAYEFANDKESFMSHLTHAQQTKIQETLDEEIDLKQLEQQRETRMRKASYRLE